MKNSFRSEIQTQQKYPNCHDISRQTRSVFQPFFYIRIIISYVFPVRPFVLNTFDCGCAVVQISQLLLLMSENKGWKRLFIACVRECLFLFARIIHFKSADTFCPCLLKQKAILFRRFYAKTSE